MPSLNATSIANGIRARDDIEAAHLSIDLTMFKLLVEHRAAHGVMNSLVVINSTTTSIVVIFFVNDTSGVHTVSSSFSLLSTSAGRILDIFNTVLLVGFVDLETVSEEDTAT